MCSFDDIALYHFTVTFTEIEKVGDSEAVVYLGNSKTEKVVLYLFKWVYYWHVPQVFKLVTLNGLGNPSSYLSIYTVPVTVL